MSTYIQQLGEDLGVYDDGCKCQVIVLVNIDEGNIYDYHIISERPTELKLPEEMWFKDYLITKQDGLYIDWQKANYLTQEEKDNESFEKVETINIEGKVLVPDPCSIIDDNLSLLDYHNKQKINNIKDGWYELLVEMGCWTTYCYDYGCYEGDGDVAFKILKSDVKPEDYDIELEEDIKE